MSPAPRRCGCAARRRRWRATSSPPGAISARAVGELRELGDQVHLGEALRARGFAEVFGGSLGDAEWFLGEADHVYAAGRRPARPGLGAAAPGVGVVPRRRPCRVATALDVGDRVVRAARRSQRRHVGARAARLRAPLRAPQRRGRGARRRRARGGASLGRRVGRGDDAQPARPASGCGRATSTPPARSATRRWPASAGSTTGSGSSRRWARSTGRWSRPAAAPMPNAASRRSWCSPTPSARWPTR